jgi:RNA polymerase sigma factor (sigma-70 family)
MHSRPLRLPPLLGMAVPTTPSDSELSELYERFAPIVMRRARAILGNDELAREAVQETFAKVIARWDQFRGDASPTTWIYRITTNHCLNQLRNQKGRRDKLQRRHHELLPKGPAAPDLGLEAAAVRALLDGCDDETRRIVVHIYFDDLTREETAQLVGRSVPTVRKRIRGFLEHARTHMVSIGVAAVGLLFLIVGGNA